MQAKINPDREFKAFDLTITIETVEELKYLWHLFNRPPVTILQSNMCEKFDKDKVSNHGIWKALDNKVKLLRLRR